ncbi:MAG: 6-carboxytetrahydropterin synthase QueD [Fusobacteriota bacterium]
MYTLKTKNHFDSAHFLADYNGKCQNIHGHRWEVEVEIQSKDVIKSGSKKGMVVDFGDIKDDLKKEADYFDHSLVIEKGTMRKKTLECLIEDSFKIIEVNFRPTAENFAKNFFDKLENLGYNVRKVTVYETPKNCATYQK